MTRRGPSAEEWLARAGALGLSRRGNELFGPCPHCGGEDRFHVHWRGGRAGVFSCRQCHTKGNTAAASRILEAAGFARDGRADFPPPPARPRPPAPRLASDTTAAQAAAAWRAAVPATPDTPAARRLAARGVWGGPGDTPLPDSVRWIARAVLARLDDRARAAGEQVLGIPPGILGCIVYRAAPAIQLDALAPDGGPPATRWRRTVGPLGDALFVAHGGGRGLHLCEGPTDALALAWHRGALALAVVGSAFAHRADRLAREARGRPVTVWPDGGDRASARQALALALGLRIRGISCRVIQLPSGQDPADMGPRLATIDSDAANPT